MNNKNIIEVKKITKIFPGTIALKDVDFELKKGEVHALVGENGAGKSTLMKIFCGAYNKTSGQIFIDGEEKNFTNTKQALELGISIIYQELENLPKLTVAENIFLGRLPGNKKIPGFISTKHLYKETEELLKKLNIKLNPKIRVGELSIAEQQLVEIAKALSKEVKVLIMDEPTSYLTQDETEKLFKTINDIKQKGIGVIYVSHRLQEIIEIADRITVLRDGEKVITVNDMKEIDEEKIISFIVGHKLIKQEKVSMDRKKVVFEVNNLSITRRLENFNMKLYEGEILGIVGLTGSGKDELVKALVGLWPSRLESILIDGKKVSLESPNLGIKHKIVYLPEERKSYSIFPELTVRENISPIWLHQIFKKFLLSKKMEMKLAKKFVEKLSVKTPTIEQKVINLSGGNQQKMIFSRLLTINPRILLLHDPTRGIDVGSKEEIYKIIKNLVKEGASIILLSSEIEEVCNIANRVIVLSKGKVAGEFIDNDVQIDKCLNYATR